MSAHNNVLEQNTGAARKAFGQAGNGQNPAAHGQQQQHYPAMQQQRGGYTEQQIAQMCGRCDL